jgi:hypothetical protein
MILKFSMNSKDIIVIQNKKSYKTLIFVPQKLKKIAENLKTESGMNIRLNKKYFKFSFSNQNSGFLPM